MRLLWTVTKARSSMGLFVPPHPVTQVDALALFFHSCAVCTCAGLGPFGLRPGWARPRSERSSWRALCLFSLALVRSVSESPPRAPKPTASPVPPGSNTQSQKSITHIRGQDNSIACHTCDFIRFQLDRRADTSIQMCSCRDTDSKDLIFELQQVQL